MHLNCSLGQWTQHHTNKDKSDTLYKDVWKPFAVQKNRELEVIFSPFQFLIFLQAVAKEVRHFYSGLITKVLNHTTSVS